MPPPALPDRRTGAHPLPYRDPVYDGATDPVVVRDDDGALVMFYTQRRASVAGPGVAWVHGSQIGRAVSTDDGASWAYDGVVDGLPLPGDEPEMTFWAPAVVRMAGRWRLFVSVIRGIPERWEGHERVIRDYAIDALRGQPATGGDELTLSSRLVIDAAVAHGPDDRWRLWYKDEAHDSTTWLAESSDGVDWSVVGCAIAGRPHEGPSAFALGGWWWMLVDEWRGMGVYRSRDALAWQRQGGDDAVILAEPGAHRLDRTVGRHGEVLIEGEGGRLFYFTHPFWDGNEVADAAAMDARISAVHEARLTVRDGVLECRRAGL
mgnify:FL=1